MSPTAFLQRPLCWLEAISRLHGDYNVQSAAPNFGYDLCVRKSTPAERARLRLGHWTIVVNGAEPIRPATLRAFAAMFAPAGFDAGGFCCAYGLAENVCLVAGGPEQPVTLAVDRFELDVGCHWRAPTSVAATLEVAGCVLMVPGARALEQMRVTIVEPGARTPLPDGVVGEIVVAGPCATRGYMSAGAFDRRNGKRTASVGSVFCWSIRVRKLR